MSRVSVIINASGGSFVEGETGERLEKAFADRGVEAEIRRFTSGDDLSGLARDLVNHSDVVGAAGGDGTISSVAGEVAVAGKTLAVLPLGTFNHFSKDLGIPGDLETAVEIITLGKVDKIDICHVNDVAFINNSSIGLYPRMVKRRESLQHRLGASKWSAALFAAIQVLRRGTFLKLRLRAGGVDIYRETPFVFVGNNEYKMELYNIGRRESLKDGVLGVYVLNHGGRWGAARLLVNTLLGRLEQGREFEFFTTTELTIETKRKKTLLVAHDGEVGKMETPLRYGIEPGGLSVLVPAEGQR